MGGLAMIVLVRHGATEWSAAGRHTGRTDVRLTAEGRRQAGLLAERLAAWTFVRVLTSPLSRALDTCRIAGLANRAELRPELGEWDYGAYEGRSTADIRRERPGWYLWRDGVPEGETLAAVGRRAGAVVAELRRTAGDVAVFAHGHLLRVLAARWLELPPDFGRFLALSTATISLLGDEHGVPAVLRWNDGAHLEAGWGAGGRSDRG